MPLNEYIAGLHVHTTYSDGEFSHAQVAEAASRAGLDCLCRPHPLPHSSGPSFARPVV